MSAARPRAQATILRGPAGGLEALIETPAASAEVGHFGVICHPHPLKGGTLDNKVVYTVARAFQELGAPTIRFNFRGVGASAGQYDDGRGETEDALAVIAEGRRRWPGAALWLAGFSFGGAVAIRAARPAEAARLVSVAPAVLGMEPFDPPACPWVVIQGETDDVVDPVAVREWVTQLDARPAPEFTVVPGVEHFFHGHLPELRQAVMQFLRGSAP